MRLPLTRFFSRPQAQDTSAYLGFWWGPVDDSGSVVGLHQWDEGVLEETGGDFLCMHVRFVRSFLIHISAPPRVSRYLADCAQYSDLRRILADSAKEHGASFIVDRAVSVKADRERPTVTLSSGTVLTADVVVGADGPVLEGCTTPAGTTAREILRDPAAFYVNIHNDDFPAGALRGQLSR